MTVSTTSTWERTRDQIVTSALWRCGVLHAQQIPAPDQLALGVVFLDEILHALIGHGVLLRCTERYTQTVVPGVATLSVPVDTISIDSASFATIKDSGGQDILVQSCNRDTYQMIFNKTSIQGTPTYWYSECNSDNSWTIYLYPIPSSQYVSFTYPRIRKIKDDETGNLSLDVPPKFTLALTYTLARDLAVHYKRLQLIPHLGQLADDEMTKALDSETVNGNVMFRVENIVGDW